jgi:hypothetical protein
LHFFFNIIILLLNNNLTIKIMGKIITTFVLFLVTIFSFEAAYSQVRYTPPAVTLGAAFDMNFANNDAYGRVSNLDSYGMRAGKGFEVFAKFGLGMMKRHRITTSVSYNKMINYDKNANFFSQVFSGNPDDIVHTNFTILTGAVGYEYLFGAPCCNKQHLGLALTFNSIGNASDNLMPTKKYESTFRLGMQFNAGYEFMLGPSGQYGLVIGFKYNWANLLSASNKIDSPDATTISLNDGNEAGGRGFTRWISFTTINIGFNFYTGVKQVMLRK